MTALNTPIVFNNSTGSDTAASGCGPSSAVSVMVQTSAGSNTATASWTGTISAGDLMYIPDSSFTGRRFNVIASVGSGSLTFDNNWDDSSFGTSGYVGGKRATFDNADSRELFTNFHVAVLDKIKTETDQTLTSTITIGRHFRNPFVIYADDQKTITATGDFECFNATQNRNASFVNLKFVCATTSSKSAILGGNVNVNNCQFGEDGSSNNWKYGLRGAHYGHRCFSQRCIFYGKGETVSGGFASGGTHYNGMSSMRECFVKDYEIGFRGYARHTVCNGNVFVSCKYGTTAHQFTEEISGNIFHDISSDAITYNSPLAEHFQRVLFTLGSNIFSDVTGHLLSSNISEFYLGDSTDSKTLYTHPGLPTLYAYNSSNTFNNMPTFPVQTLTADPFVDAANGDFNINNALGGGSVLRSTKYTLGG